MVETALRNPLNLGSRKKPLARSLIILLNCVGMVSTETIQYARRVLGSVRRIPFSDEPMIEVADHLALLTVVSGVRPIGAFGFAEKGNGERLEMLREILVGQRLNCVITKQIPHRDRRVLRDAIGDLAEVWERIDAESDARHTGRLLWVYQKPEMEEQIKKALDRQLEVGLLLGYPPCCVEAHEATQARFERAFAAAIVAAVGTDPGAVERALREDHKVQIEGDPTDSENMRRTDALYPFVFHVACNSCLSSDDSPSAKLNREYGALARQYDQAFHHWFQEMAKIGVEIGQVILEAEKQNLRPDELKEPLRSQLRELFDRRDRIYVHIVGS
jgi:hypothetical protein